jgi:hypothetical protein
MPVKCFLVKKKQIYLKDRANQNSPHSACPIKMFSSNKLKDDSLFFFLFNAPPKLNCHLLHTICFNIKLIYFVKTFQQVFAKLLASVEIRLNHNLNKKVNVKVCWKSVMFNQHSNFYFINAVLNFYLLGLDFWF